MKPFFFISLMTGNVGSLENREITEKGEYVRPESGFRNWISADGTSGFKAEAGEKRLIFTTRVAS